MTRLPRHAYCDADWHRKERETLFANSWVFAGTVTDFSQAGDFITCDASAFPLAVIQDKGSNLNAYHNICRHRGAILLEAKRGNAGKSLVCPYHRWTYGLDGRLRGAPDMAACFSGLERANHSLHQAGIGVFRDLVFVNPDPNANFDNWIAPISEKAWPHDIRSTELRESAPLFYDLKCDWKVFVENALDGYHLAYLHEHTLGGPTPSQNVWERCGDHMIWYAIDDGIARHRIPSKVRTETKCASKIKHTLEHEYGGVYFLFPSTLITPTPFGFSVSSLMPSKPGKSHMVVRNWVGPWQSKDERKYIPGFDKTTGRISSDKWTKHPLETGDFQTEDVWICERVQKGLESPAYQPGPLAKGPGAEDPIKWFQQTLSEYSSRYRD